ncbi:MAG: DUF423 domain-containing protein [Janthinobacterium lividum]
MKTQADAGSAPAAVTLQPADSTLSPWARLFLVCGALLGFATVAMGALVTHLPDRSLASGGRELLRSAVQMQGWHTVALLAAGLLADRRPGLPVRLAGLAFLLGIGCFCAGLYTLGFAGDSAWARRMGHLAPIGGSVLMLGWLLLALACLRR